MTEEKKCANHIHIFKIWQLPSWENSIITGVDRLLLRATFTPQALRLTPFLIHYSPPLHPLLPFHSSLPIWIQVMRGENIWKITKKFADDRKRRWSEEHSYRCTVPTVTIQNYTINIIDVPHLTYALLFVKRIKKKFIVAKAGCNRVSKSCKLIKGSIHVWA